MADLRFKLCPRCKRLKPVGNGAALCDECDSKNRAEKAARREQSRDYKREYASRLDSEDPKYRRFYRSREWEMTSKQKMVDAGHKCEECGKPGTDVHHVVPIQTDEGWRRRFDVDNLKLLCVRCHNKAHERFGHHRK